RERRTVVHRGWGQQLESRGDQLGLQLERTPLRGDRSGGHGGAQEGETRDRGAPDDGFFHRLGSGSEVLGRTAALGAAGGLSRPAAPPPGAGFGGDLNR